MEEYLRRVYSAIEHNDDLENLQVGIGRHVFYQSKVTVYSGPGEEYFPFQLSFLVPLCELILENF